MSTWKFLASQVKRRRAIKQQAKRNSESFKFTGILHEGEIIKDIEEFPGIYAVTTHGRFWSYKKFNQKQGNFIFDNDKKQVKLGDTMYSKANIVYETFIGKLKKGEYATRKDRLKGYEPSNLCTSNREELLKNLRMREKKEKRKCIICSTIFTISHPMQKSCSIECKEINLRNLSKKSVQKNIEKIRIRDRARRLKKKVK